MFSLLIRRLAQMVFVMIGISVLVFLIFFATPGADPASRIAGRNASPEVVAQVRKSFGFDKPLPIQYLVMMKRLFIDQDLTSFVNRGEVVVPEIMSAAPVTLSLVLGLIGISMPVYWLGEIVNLITQSRMHDSWVFSWVPPLGYTALTEDPWLWFKSLLLPWITLAILYIGLYGRVLRASLVEAGQEDYIRTARSKGLSESRILLRHALRTSLIAFVTLFGLDFGALVGGAALLTEVVFALQGVGRLTYQALLDLDLPVIMATVMYASFFVVFANALVDILYGVLDPRVRVA